MILMAVQQAWRRLPPTSPYFLVEILVPGGTIVALLLWLSSGHAKGQLCDPRPVPHTSITAELFIGVADAAATHCPFQRPEAQKSSPQIRSAPEVTPV
jgi:hypothetical protein